MKLQIIDASVAIKWFLADEPKADLALEVLDNIKKNPKNFAVPELFFNEMLHVLCKLTPNEIQIQEYMEALQDLGFQRLGNGRQLLKKSVTLNKTYQLSGYDAIYAANAVLTKGIWVTSDSKAHKKIAKLGVSRIL